MRKSLLSRAKPAVALALLFLIFGVYSSSSQTMCIKPGSYSDQIEGVKEGFRFELWSQDAKGTACMTLGPGALFSGEWDGIFNYLARRGLGYDQTQTHQEVGRFFATYKCDYRPTTESGNSYLSIYGWTVDPLTEFYVVEDWRRWIPSMAEDATFKGTIEVNDGIYDIYQNTRVEQPSIVGTATFEQYFSIRREVRNSGTINISDHFDIWESLGVEMGKLYEVTFVVEGYMSNGSFEFTELDIYVENDSTSDAEKE